jgi:hypothetical protein
LDFEWDRRKAASNERKHGIDFADAVAVFEDDHALTMPDDHPDAKAAEKALWVAEGARHGTRFYVGEGDDPYLRLTYGEQSPILGNGGIGPNVSEAFATHALEIWLPIFAARCTKARVVDKWRDEVLL